MSDRSVVGPLDSHRATKEETMSGPSGRAEPVIEELIEVWASIVVACEQLDDEQWDRATDCPGWTVKDQVSHLIGIEQALLGEPAPPPLGDVPAHVLNPFGKMNEAWVEVRRGVPGPAVLAEFVATTNRRIDALSAMDRDQFDTVGWSPVGDVPYREFMVTRILDCWAHEQDIRRALDRPGGRNGAGERVVLDRCERTMPYVVGKRVAPSDGTSVLFVVTGVMGRDILVAVDGGRASVPVPPVDPPSVTLAMDQEAFWRRCFGRVTPEELTDSGSVSVVGDVPLGRQVLSAMAFMT
jgi:uncharacterized protein (TIGR03083 family)